MHDENHSHIQRLKKSLTEIPHNRHEQGGIGIKLKKG